MPHMRGFESVRIFHERAPAVPLIAMSGYAFANLNSPAPDFLRWRWSWVRRAVCASRSRRTRCSPPSTIAWRSTVPRASLPRPRACVSAAPAAADAGNGSFTANAGHAYPGRAPGDVARPPRIAGGSIQFARRPRISSFTSRAFPRAWSRRYRHVHLTRLAAAAWGRFCRKTLSHAVERQTCLQYPY
ncbi:hypothetical protein ACVWXL_007213 [Bradyrhizobium sp. GM22.5]